MEARMGLQREGISQLLKLEICCIASSCEKLAFFKISGQFFHLLCWDCILGFTLEHLAYPLERGFPKGTSGGKNFDNVISPLGFDGQSCWKYSKRTSRVVQGHLLCCGRRWKTFGGDRCCFCKTALVEANGHCPCMMVLNKA